MQPVRLRTTMMLRRPRATLALVGTVIAAALGASLATPARFGISGFATPGSQSARAQAVLVHALGYDPQAGMVILARSPIGFRSFVAQAAVARLAARVDRDPAVGRVQSAFGADRLPGLVSRDGAQTLLLVHFRSADADALTGPIDQLRAHLKQRGLALEFGGYAVDFLDANRVARTDLVRAELIALPLLAALMLVLFRGLVAASIPLLIGGSSVLVTFASLRLLSHVIGISIYALDLALLLGLGLAVDYGLFLVSRYREEARTLGVGRDAIGATLATAGLAVILSGCAVAGTSATLLLFPQEFINSMGIAGVLVALCSAGAALVITPLLLLVAGERIGVPVAASGGRNSRGRWYGWARWVMRRPWDVALVTVLVLVAAAAPSLRLKPTFADQAAIPEQLQSRQVADTIDRDFTPHLAYPVNIAIEPSRGTRIPATLLATSLARTPGVRAVIPLVLRPSGLAAIQLILTGPPYARQSQALVTALRRVRAPLLVGGNTAEFLDLKHSIVHHAPLAIALAAAATIVIVFVLTGSVVLAVKALVFDALGLAAAFGLLVLIFQDGALGITGLLAYSGPAAIETTACVVIVATTFGLTTDYSVLLLSRIVEEHAAGQPDDEAVARGVQRSGPVISSAALLIVVALLALASSRVFLVKQLAIGQALGIAVDVTFVRMLLVPSFMNILGPLNWWAPDPLRRLRLRLRGADRAH